MVWEGRVCMAGYKYKRHGVAKQRVGSGGTRCDKMGQGMRKGREESGFRQRGGTRHVAGHGRARKGVTGHRKAWQGIMCLEIA